MRYLLPVVLLLAACSEPEPEPKPAAMRPVLRFDADSPDFADDVRAALTKAGVTFEIRAAKDVPAEERPALTSPGDGGWFLFAPADQAKRVEAAYESWIASMAVSTREIPPEPPAKFAMGAQGKLDPDRVAAVRAELARRHDLDQEVRRDRSRHGEMPAVDADNTRYLKELVAEVGWIDAERFGREAANTAFLLVQHSGDLPLMTAALPEIEKDVRAGRLGGQPYALLYDRLMLMTGGRQRYGTQIVVEEDGRQVVSRLEDPDRVDERRRAIGLGPLADYLALFGGEVTIERSEGEAGQDSR